MAGTNNFLVFGTNTGANVIDQVTYSGLASRSNGFSAGVASSAQLNKVWRQGSAIANAIGQYIADQGYDALDNGDAATLLSNLKNALAVQIDAQSGNFTIDTGAANAYVVAINPPITSYPDGMTLRFRATNANTGASTLNAGAGAVPLRNNVDGALVAGDIPALSLVTVTYIAALGHFVINTMVPSQTQTAQSSIVVRQCVQYGPMTTPTSGNPAQADLIPQSQVGNTLATGVTLKCSVAATLFSVANGFNSDGSQNNLNWLASADIPVPNLTASSTCYIWVDTVARTAGFVTVADAEQKGGTIPVTANQYTYDRAGQKMYLGNGSAAAQSNRLIVAEVDTSGSAVAAIRVRPYLLKSEGDWVTPLPGLAVAFSQNHNLGLTEAIDGYFEFRCLTAEDVFTVGEIVRGATGTNSGGLNNQTVRFRRNTANMIAGGATPWVLSGGGGTLVSITLARWAYRFVCSRQNR